ALGVPVEHAGRPVYPLARGARVSFLDGATVVGDEGSVHGVLDVAAGARPGVKGGHDLAGLLGRLGDAPLRMSVRLAGFQAILSRLPIPAELREIQAFAAGLDLLESTAEAKFVFPAADPAALATKLDQAVRDLVSKLRQSSFLRLFAD